MDEYKELTEMYLIAALLAYGFQYSKVDRTNRNRQKFCFSTSKKSPVFILTDGIIGSQVLGVEEIADQYTNRTLMYPPNYPDTLRSVKFAILSNK
jgi:hypothetical protein